MSYCNRLFAGNDVYQQCCWFVMNKTVFTGEYLFDTICEGIFICVLKNHHAEIYSLLVTSGS